MTQSGRSEDQGGREPFVFSGQAAELRYFAYGPNMSREQMHERGLRCEAVAVARLADHKVAFFGYAKTWDGAVATVVPEPGREVWGVVYAMTRSDWERLDSSQDVRLDGTGSYFHFPARVTDAAGNAHTAFLYVKDQTGDPKSPSRQYLERILAGGREHGLPEAYLAELAKTPAVPASYPVPRQGKGSFDVQGDCSACGDAGLVPLDL